MDAVLVKPPNTIAFRKIDMCAKILDPLTHLASCFLSRVIIALGFVGAGGLLTHDQLNINYLVVLILSISSVVYLLSCAGKA